ncbi:MAG: apolipoprotein N-acyltransferase [Hyphomicrobiales bacterium]|nr:apolipoprotein N-acyltransferase [Hyphomicrobiales bacterium]MCP5370162.1 apolipoprotein N-acyltransferase [Hyphomicrobiales bacterium]
MSGLGGWRRRGTLALLGLLAALALPPLYLVPLLWLALPGLVWILNGRPGRLAAFGAGWWFGFGYFTAGFYWIGFAMMVEPEKYAWMIPFSVFGLGAGMAVFCGLTLLATRLLAPRPGWGQVLVLAAAWTAFEWVRGWAFTGFPWNLAGTVWAFSDAMVQPAAAVGAYGLSLVTVILAAAPAVLPGTAAARRGLAAAVAVLVLAWGGGALRLALAPTQFVDGVRLRLVQPNIPQRLKWAGDLRRGHVERQVEMSLAAPAPGAPPPTHVIWGETMVPAFVNRDPAARALAARAAPPGGALLTGGLRMPDDRTAPFQVWNSLFALARDGAILATYDKFHLLPFGEYVPFRQYLDIAKITAGRTDFSRGAGPRTLDVPGLPPVGPLICYEAIFPAAVTDPARRPKWLLNITNDAWFGRSPGPYQHLAATRLRAVEEGLPLVRVANTGISAVVDPLGRTLSALPLQESGVLDSGLPRDLPGGTPFARWGNGVLAPLVVLAAALGLWLARRRTAANG